MTWLAAAYAAAAYVHFLATLRHCDDRHPGTTILCAALAITVGPIFGAGLLALGAWVALRGHG